MTKRYINNKFISKNLYSLLFTKTSSPNPFSIKRRGTPSPIGEGWGEGFKTFKKRVNIIFAIILFAITSCEKVIEVDLPETDKRLVVEGIISNEPGIFTVKLSRTQKYKFIYDSASIKYESGAKVIISDDAGQIDTLREASTGIFKTHSNITKGKIGRSYHIDIFTNDGKHYKSKPEEMIASPEIDTMYYYRIYSDKLKSGAYRCDVYIDWQDPVEEQNYYMFVVSYNWNGIWQQQYQWNWLLNDNLTNGLYYKKTKVISEYDGKFFSIKINLYALQKDNYDYWRIMNEQKWTNIDGYINNTVPLVGNIFNADDPYDYAIGYFQVSATSTKTVYVDR
jgi:hypothetical protein